MSNNYDSVGDGIADWWRVMYFGPATSTNVNSCATCNPDNDGYSNLTHYMDGTNPLQPQPAMDVLVNQGSAYTTSLTIPIQPLSTEYPNVLVSVDPSMSNALLLPASGGPSNYALSNSEGLRFLTRTRFSRRMLDPCRFG